MLKTKLKDKMASVQSVESWKEAVRLCAKPLLDQGYILPRYIDSMIANVEKNGPYIVIMPRVAIPHSRPEEGVLKTGLSLLKLEEAVEFPEGQMVELLFALAANDNDQHMDLISSLSDLLMDQDAMKKMFAAKNVKELEACL